MLKPLLYILNSQAAALSQKQIQQDIIRKADKYSSLLHSALIVTIIRPHSYSLVFLMSNNWQLGSVDAPRGLPLLLIASIC